MFSHPFSHLLMLAKWLLVAAVVVVVALRLSLALFPAVYISPWQKEAFANPIGLWPRVYVNT
jgi:hypothetical protein